MQIRTSFLAELLKLPLRLAIVLILILAFLLCVPFLLAMFVVEMIDNCF
jgi:hypothetical protein